MARIKIVSLISLLAFWVGLVAFRFLTDPEPERVPLKYVSGQKRSPQAPAIAAPMPSIKRWPLIRKPELPAKTSRNIFAKLPGVQKGGQARLRSQKGTGTAGRSQSLAQAPRGGASPSPRAPAVYVPPPPPPPPTPEEIAAQQERARIEQERQRREQAIQQARQQMTQYRFLGYLTTDGVPQAFVGKGKDLYIVRTGEMLDGQVLVNGIDGTSVTLAVPAFDVSNKLELAK